MVWKPVTRRLPAAEVASLLFGIAIAAHASEQDAKQLSAIIVGLREFAKHFDERELGYRIEYTESIRSLDAKGDQEHAARFDAVFARQRDHLFVQVQRYDGPKPVDRGERIYWTDGVCVQRKGNTVFFWPHLIPQGRGYQHYTDGIFVDTYRGLKWSDPGEQELTGAANPSELFIFALPRILEQNRSKYRLRPVTELVDGAKCTVLEWPGRDILWIDRESGYLVRRRKFSLKVGVPLVDFSNSEVYEHSPGFWLPKLQEEVNYSVHPADLVGKPRRTVVRRLTAATLASLPPETFEPELSAKNEPLGVVDNIRGISYVQHPSSVDPLSQAAQHVRGRFRKSPVSRASLWLINGSAAGCISLLIMWRIRKRRG